MARTVKVTDLTQTEGDPGARATPHPQREPLESFIFEIKVPDRLGGGTVKINTRTRDGSRLTNAIIMFLTVTAGCIAVAAMTGASAAGIHVPAWAAVGIFLVPSGIYVLINSMGSHSRK